MLLCGRREERGGEEIAAPLIYAILSSPSELLVGGADAEKPLEENEAEIRSCL